MKNLPLLFAAPFVLVLLLAFGIFHRHHSALRNAQVFSDQQNIVWDHRVIDLGMMTTNQHFTVQAAFRNQTGKGLALVPESCCGMVATVNPTTVPPGGKGIITMTGQTFSPVEGLQQDRIVRVHTNAMISYLDQIHIHYSLHPKWHPVPEEVVFSQVIEGQRTREKFRLYYDAGAARCKRIIANDPRINVQWEPTPGKDYQDFIVMFSAQGKPSEEIKTGFDISTADDLYPKIHIPVLIGMRPSAIVVPNVINFGAFFPGHSPKKEISVLSYGVPATIQIVRLPAWLEVRHKPVTGKTVLLADAKIADPGAFKDTIILRVKTKHTLDIPVVVIGYVEN